LMGGVILVESQSAHGSTFTFTLSLPIEKNKEEKQPQFRYPNFQDLSVLIVEDNKTNRFILRKTLSSWGFKAHEATNGAAALHLLYNLENPVDLVILDHEMPEMDGVEFAQKMRTDGRFDDVKIIMLSSLGKLDAALQQSLGIARSIVKPVKQSKLFDHLLHVLRKEENQEIQVIKDPLPVQPVVSSLKTILLAEDNLDNQNLASRILMKQGYQVEVAGNGKIAVEKTKDVHYDLILMDIQMPVMDGFEATRHIREWEEKQRKERVPIIALTAHALQGYREKCLQSGIDDYITKPLRKRNLLDLVQNWLTIGAPVSNASEAGEPKIS
ncbi:MAG TPA: response regulator, partial [bacterium]